LEEVLQILLHFLILLQEVVKELMLEVEANLADLVQGEVFLIVEQVVMILL
jgi:hypothetical protein